ncbi:efflux RND transporter periplasmic adaptor subunit [Anaeromyxobacter dehalogenans]|uniref:Secretion protein HlyD n=1 Tax=Anaeromyxobacter dehalogenans (strain 2CP-C) TaxID=290397 RepID=Q2IQ77_ANADE|nr:efflux RND transporter periplasmic adaptor subunit [Anaeromyxobacter dehalogenans]ABC80958.1 secretion protein HlyD [Anaeromyxobacter dehalogenans 2CP-C]
MPPLRPALLLALAAAACGRRGADRPPPPPAPATAPAPAPAPAAGPAAAAAHLAAPERVRFAPRVTATGTLKARQASVLAVSVAGTLERVAVRRGQEVREGALLAVLDTGAASAAVRQAEAAVAAARAQLALAEDALARTERLRREEGASEAQATQARAQRDLAAAHLAAAQAQAEQARVHLSHHRLVAPFAGVVTRVPDGVGITVSPGVPLVTLVTTRELVLETSLTQSEAAELRPGARVAVSLPGIGARTADAVVTVVVPAVDAATNRVPVEIAVPNPDGRFLANAYARADLPRGAERDAFRVPAPALVQRTGGHAVWVAGADGKARALPVRLLAEEGETAVIVPEGGAWPEGLRVVTDPPVGLAEGTALAQVRG